jgi:hypothetical protein
MVGAQLGEIGGEVHEVCRGGHHKLVKERRR